MRDDQGHGATADADASGTRQFIEASEDFLARLVKDKTVLDVGCAAHSAVRESADNSWLHKHLARSARSILGLDILEAEVGELRRRGYNMIVGDATKVTLGEKFDFVVAGELVEHLDNPAAFLRNMAAHLNEDGRLVLTTPHVFFAYHVIESFLWTPAQRWNAEHVAWYCPFTLGNLLRRNGLEVESCYYFTRSAKLRAILKALHLPCYRLLATSLLVVARPAH